MSRFRIRAFSAVAAAALAACAAPASAENILFMGNSFLYAPFFTYNGVGVTDLNNTGMSGEAGLFKTFTLESGLNYNVSIEAVGGQGINYHYANKLGQIGSQRWDTVVMHDYSTLSSTQPGNPQNLYTYSALMEQYIHGTNASFANPNGNANANVYLMETWARADQIYNTPGGFYNGTSPEYMTTSLHNAYYTAAAMDTHIKGVIPVGDAWLLAMQTGIADRNPYDGIDPGKVDLWASDHYHQSIFGGYLEALVLYGQVTGLDPRLLGAGEQAAATLGLTGVQATTAQVLAFQQLQISAVPESETYAMLLAGLGVVGFLARRRSRVPVAA
jgi:hypothetical protein